jgi:hypothetical protein
MYSTFDEIDKQLNNVRIHGNLGRGGGGGGHIGYFASK